MIVLKVRVSGEREVIRSLKRIGRFPAMTIEAMREWGETLERNMILSVRAAKIESFTGGLMNRIEWRQAPKGKTGRLFIPYYGVMLNSMDPHWVSIKPRRMRLLSWGLQARNPYIRSGANDVAVGIRKRYGVYVTPHPFIRYGYNRTRPLLMPMIRRRLAQAA